MSKVKSTLMSGNLSVAYAIKQLNVDVIAAYPITPQTHIIEKLSEYVANRELDANFMLVESEHSAISSCVAAASTGARVFTSSSSQGILLMHEILFITSALRLPVVMLVANRSISAPINIWCDHGDIMPQRDTGWIQIFAESAQEAYDRLIQAYRISEDSSVRLPVMVNSDGFILSHTYEPIIPLEDSKVADFTPWKIHPLRLDPENPLTMGAFGYPEYYYETRFQSQKALEDSINVITKVDKEFGEISGRTHGIVSSYKCEDADFILISMGSLSTSIRATVKKLRAQNKKVGEISLKIWRPFPSKIILNLIKNCKAVGVVDRALSPGAIAGPVYNDITSLLYLSKMNIPCINFFTGLGGRDVTISDIHYMFEKLKEISITGLIEDYKHYIGLR